MLRKHRNIMINEITVRVYEFCQSFTNNNIDTTLYLVLLKYMEDFSNNKVIKFVSKDQQLEIEHQIRITVTSQFTCLEKV